MTCAETIKKIRKILYWHQAELARALDISKSSLSKYESGDAKPRLPTARKIKALADKHGIKIKMEDLIHERP